MGLKARAPKRPESHQAFIEAIADEGRRRDIDELDTFIRSQAPGLAPIIMHGMLGYGPYHYRYASGREGDTAKICLSNRKQYISMYVCGGDEGGYIAEQFRDALPGADIGKGCVRFKRLSDLDREALANLIRAAAQFG